MNLFATNIYKLHSSNSKEITWTLLKVVLPGLKEKSN